MSFENRIKSKACPRGCGHKIMTGYQQQYNAKSTVDGLQICSTCFIDETYAKYGVER